MPSTPDFWEQAKLHLSNHDAVMKTIIANYPSDVLVKKHDAFITLARSITGQQISVKAAASIWDRLEHTLGNISPQTIIDASENTIHSAGYSAQKIRYLKHIAQAFAEGNISGNILAQMDDEQALKALTSLKGVGQWTAEMFLIFHLHRPNILPLGDLGLVKAIQKHYNDGKTLSHDQIHTIAKPWHPYCSVATWYLWRSLDPLPVEY